MIYLITFIISIIFIRIGIKKTENQSDNGRTDYKLHIIPTSIGLMLPCILAALRDSSVGSDVNFYVVPFFNTACRSSMFSAYTKLIGGKKTDLAYNLINYVISRFTYNIAWLFFVIEFIIVIFVFLGCWQMRHIAKPWKSMLFFYLIFYNMTLSTVRQCCACALIFYGLCTLMSKGWDKRNVITAVLCIIAAFFFHKTAIIGVLLAAVFYFVKNNEADIKFLLLICMLAFIFLRIFQSSAISVILKIVSLFSIKYTAINFSGSGISGVTCVALLCLFQILMLELLNKTSANNYSRNFADTMIFLDGIWLFAILFLGRWNIVIRLCYYIQFFWFLSFACLDKIKCKNLESDILVQSGSIIIALFYWWFFYIYAGVHGTGVYIFG